jgi:hypothetical protein
VPVRSTSRTFTGWAVRAIARLAQKVAVTAIESLRRYRR